jgi:hypothetical protein
LFEDEVALPRIVNNVRGKDSKVVRLATGCQMPDLDIPLSHCPEKSRRLFKNIKHEESRII